MFPTRVVTELWCFNSQEATPFIISGITICFSSAVLVLKVSH